MAPPGATAPVLAELGACWLPRQAMRTTGGLDDAAAPAQALRDHNACVQPGAPGSRSPGQRAPPGCSVTTVTWWPSGGGSIGARSSAIERRGSYLTFAGLYLLAFVIALVLGWKTPAVVLAVIGVLLTLLGLWNPDPNRRRD